MSLLKQVASECLAIVMERLDVVADPTDPRRHRRKTIGGTISSDNGVTVFHDFQEENRVSYWNPALVESVNSLDYVGFVRPGTLFVSGAELHLECLRGAWARRVLKPPQGFVIKSLGDVGGIEMQEVPQTPFVSLPEVLCLIISGLNRNGLPATMFTIVETLRDDYQGMTVPKEELLYTILYGLISDGKLFCMGEHYFVPTPSMFAHQRPPMWNVDEKRLFTGKRQQEMCSRECQTGASVVNAVAPYKPPTGKKDQATSAELKSQRQEVVDNGKSRTATTVERRKSTNKNEKPGFLARLFGRPRSKHRKEEEEAAKENVEEEAREAVDRAQPLATFSAQFPPTEWLYDPRYFKSKSASSQHQQQQQQQQISSSKGKKSSKDNNNKDPKRAAEMGNSQRFVTCPENLNHKTGRWSPKVDRVRSSRQRPRMSKYLSSSSECVNSVRCHEIDVNRFKVDVGQCSRMDTGQFKMDVGHFKEPTVKKYHRSKHHKQQQLTNNEIYNLDKFRVSEPTTSDRPLTISAVDNLDKAFAGRTSTPAPSPKTAPKSRRVVESETVNENRDSAISSTSPVVTDMSSCSDAAKYSSWSGSDGQREPLGPPNTADHTYINEEPPRNNNNNNADHTYVNEKPVDHTYENLSKVVVGGGGCGQTDLSIDGTQFENLTNFDDDDEDEKHSNLPNELGQACISAV